MEMASRPRLYADLNHLHPRSVNSARDIVISFIELQWLNDALTHSEEQRS